VLQEEARRCDFQFPKRQLENGLLLATKSALSWISSPDSLPVYKRDGIRVSQHDSTSNTVYFLQTLGLPHLGICDCNKTYHILSYLSIDTSDSAKLGEMPQKKPDAVPGEKAIESGKEDMLRQVLQHMPALDWAKLDWAKLDWNQLVLMAVGFGKADMLGEVLQRMPDLNLAELNWTELVLMAIGFGKADMLGDARTDAGTQLGRTQLDRTGAVGS
jgi:hypothetical protein